MSVVEQFGRWKIQKCRLLLQRLGLEQDDNTEAAKRPSAQSPAAEASRYRPQQTPAAITPLSLSHWEKGLRQPRLKNR